MVKNIVITTISLLMPSLMWAAEFTAIVSQNQIVVGENFTLYLELSGTSAKEKPSITNLRKHFDVSERGQSSNTSIINGNVSSSTRWNYILKPKKEGDITIPSISINTADGQLGSQPISLSVGKASSLPSANEQRGLAITAQVSKRSPYKSEAITYTAKLTARSDMANVQLSNLSVENAIVDAISEPTIYDTVQNGVAMKVLEIKYRIIPLESGQIIIPATVIQGGIPVNNDHFDPFDIFDNFDNFGNFGAASLEPFSVASNEITLEVKSPVSGITPWLPAASLEITENWNNKQTMKVGEPITRGFTILAEGISGSQLPSLDSQQNQINGFKIYADNPVVEDNADNGNLLSQREENYTLIPQEAGTLILPEISIAWWNLNTDKIAYASIPARTLEIKPASGGAGGSTLPQQSLQQNLQPLVQNATPTAITQPFIQNSNPWLYAVIAMLLIILVFVLFWVMSLQRKVASLAEIKKNTKRKVKENTRQTPAITNKELAKVTSAKELHHFLQNYGQQHWNTARNTPLETLISAAKQQCPAVSKEADLVLKALLDALYTHKHINIEDIKARCAILVENKTNAQKAALNKIAEKLPDLNPS